MKQSYQWSIKQSTTSINRIHSQLTIPVDTTNFAEIVVKRLQVFVAVERTSGKSHVISAQSANVFEVFVFDEFHHDVLFRLDLQHF